MSATLSVPAPVDPGLQSRRLRRIGWAVVLGGLVPILAWMTLAPLHTAVVAPGMVKVDLNRRPVQHLEGGLVREVRVRDGQRVQAGEAVLVLGDVGVDVESNRLRLRLEAERATLARHEAEQALAARIAFPPELLRAADADPRVVQAVQREGALFEARREALASESALLRQQLEHVERESAALAAQIEQVASALAIQKRDHEAHARLRADGFISDARLAQIEALVAEHAGRLEERRGELARARQRKVDIDLRLRALRNTWLQTASDQHRVVASRIAEIEQELRRSDDTSARQVVVAPVSGEIIDLRVTSPGAVVRAGEAVAEIVPDQAALAVEARIRPEEVDHVLRGQPARVRLAGHRWRNVAMLGGEVSYVSADRLVDRATGQPYFSVQVLVPPAALEGIEGLRLQAGMPAEVYIDGPVRTPLQYLMEPLTSTMRGAARRM